MVEPVISSRFGKRPILEVPAMQVSGHTSLEVPSIQSPVMNTTSNIVPVPVPVASPTQIHLYNPPYVAGVIPQVQIPYPGLDVKQQSAPVGPFYSPQGREFYYGPNGEIIFPPPVNRPNNLFPGVASSYTGYAPMPPPAPFRIPYPNYGMMTPGFNITCELEYGRVMNINVRDSDGEFRGIPEFLRSELLRTYGSFPYTEVRIKLEGGEFHIYATHENRPKHRRHRRHRDSDSDSDSDRNGPYPEWSSDVDSYTSGVRPRNPGDRPRGVVHERGWNRFR
ncbi:unnamed protein product [Candidula unifasciata]|uniref:Uncharacterized protein n=1 Tax=Candidula unifasciata TaxID=100452 RepID=A0A8S3ZBC2_9EUPU|nr:unnamed protein product [Candidula unifasciata]